MFQTNSFFWKKKKKLSDWKYDTSKKLSQIITVKWLADIENRNYKSPTNGIEKSDLLYDNISNSDIADSQPAMSTTLTSKYQSYEISNDDNIWKTTERRFNFSDNTETRYKILKTRKVMNIKEN